MVFIVSYIFWSEIIDPIVDIRSLKMARIRWQKESFRDIRKWQLHLIDYQLFDNFSPLKAPSYEAAL